MQSYSPGGRRTARGSAAPTLATVKQSKLMVVDDEPTNVKLVRRFLELEGFSQFVTTTDGRKAMTLIRDERPDCILLDLMMPHVSGLDVLDELRHDPTTAHIPAIFLTAVTDHKVRRDALERGADRLSQQAGRSRGAGAARRQRARRQGVSGSAARPQPRLEAAVRERTRQLEQAHREIGLVLARAAEYRDNDTGFHVVRVGRYARLIGEELGIVGDEADLLERAAQLHDVGKIGIPDAILLKPDRLTDEEFDLMKSHCGFGERILQPYSDDEECSSNGDWRDFGTIADGATPLLVLAHRIAMSHHEQWDGTGYPLGLEGRGHPARRPHHRGRRRVRRPQLQALLQGLVPDRRMLRDDGREAREPLRPAGARRVPAPPRRRGRRADALCGCGVSSS